MTDPAPNATPRPLPEPDSAARPEARPEPTGASPEPTGARPWPAPSPNTEWWRGEGDPDTEDRSDTADDTQPVPTVAGTRIGRHAVQPAARTSKPAPADPTEPAEEPVAEATPKAADAPEPAEPTAETGFPLWPASEASARQPADQPTDQPGADQAAAGKPSPRRTRAKAAEAAGTEWQASQMRVMRAGRPTTVKRTLQPPPKRVTKKSRPPAIGLAALLLFGLLAGFFGWVSADPFWMAVGHAQRGTATVTKCVGQGLDARCVGTFQTASFSRERVAVSALTHAEQRPGVKVPARMVSEQGRIAYTGQPSSLHLRWIVGIALVLLCGLGIAWGTGAGRLASRRARLAVYTASVGGPLLLALGVVAAAW